MSDLVDSHVLAGLAAMLGYYALAGASGMIWLSWRYRERFSLWRRLSERDRADVVLNVSLLALFLNAMYRQYEGAHAYMVGEWRATAYNIHSGSIQLPWAIAGMAGILWWMSLYLFGRAHYRACWALLIVLGLWFGIAIGSHA